MATVYLWKEVPVTMQSAVAAAKTITAITKADPGVVTATAHGYENGDIIHIEVEGMREVDDRIFKVANKTTDTFELQGENTIDYQDFSSGTAKKLTMSTSVTTIKELSASEGNFDMQDVTTIHDGSKKEVPGLPGASNYNMTMLWDPSNAAHKAMALASRLQSKLAFKFQFGSAVMFFIGYVGFKGAPGGATQGPVTCSGVFTFSGDPTYYV